MKMDFSIDFYREDDDDAAILGPDGKPIEKEEKPPETSDSKESGVGSSYWSFTILSAKNNHCKIQNA